MHCWRTSRNAIRCCASSWTCTTACATWLARASTWRFALGSSRTPGWWRGRCSSCEITCASPAYLARHGEPQRPAELAERECLLNSHYSGHEEWLYHRHHRLERVRVAGFLASNHYSLLKKAALAGTGIARLPSYMVHDELGDGRLAWLLRDYQTRSTPMFLVHPFQGGLPRRTQVLADYLLDWFERSRRQLIGLEG